MPCAWCCIARERASRPERLLRGAVLRSSRRAAAVYSSSFTAELRTLPRMCSTTTKAMNTKLMTSTCTGLLGAANPSENQREHVSRRVGASKTSCCAALQALILAHFPLLVCLARGPTLSKVYQRSEPHSLLRMPQSSNAHAKTTAR